MCFRSRSAGRLNFTKDCPHLGDNLVSWLTAWLKVVVIQLIGFLKRERGRGKEKDEEGEQKRQNDT